MDCNSVNQRIREFDSQHGNFICSNDWILFEDGARRERDVWGALISPPADPRQRAKNIVQYHQTRLNLAIAEFDHFKNNHLMHAKIALKSSTVPAPIGQPESVINKAKELQKKVKQIRAALNKAEAELDKFTPQRVRDMEAINNRNREAAENLLNELEAIEI